MIFKYRYAAEDDVYRGETLSIRGGGARLGLDNVGRPTIDFDRGRHSVTKGGIQQELPVIARTNDPEYYVPGNIVQSIHNARDAVKDDFGNWWGKVQVHPGIHTMNTGIQLTGRNQHIEGMTETIGDEGISGSPPEQGTGSVVLLGPASAIWMLEADPGLPGHQFSGATIRNLNLIGNSSVLGGVHIFEQSNFYIQNVNVGETPNGAGLEIDGGAAPAQYGYVERYMNWGSKDGILTKHISGTRFVSCTLSGNRNHSEAIQANSAGIRCTTGSGSSIFIGTIIQGYTNLINMEESWNDMFVATRLEDFTTNGIWLRRSGGNARNQGFQFYGGSLSNSLQGSTGTVMRIEAGVTDSLVFMERAEGFGTLLVDNSGTNSNNSFINNSFKMGSFNMNQGGSTGMLHMWTKLFVQGAVGWNLDGVPSAVAAGTEFRHVTPNARAPFYDQNGVVVGYVYVYPS